MGRLEDRLSRLEARTAKLGAQEAGQGHRERIFERLFHANENARREIAGLEPLPGRDNDERWEAEHEPVEHVRPPWFGAAAWEERERGFRRLFAELDRLTKAVNREDQV